MKHNVILIQKIYVSRLINGILYFLQKIPFLGKHIPSTCFKLTVLKDITYAFFVIYKCIASLIYAFLFIGLLNILPALFLQDYYSLDFSVAFTLCYVIYFIIPFPIYQSKVIKPFHLELYYHTFHMHPKTILWENSLFQYGCSFASHLIILVGCAIFTSLPLYLACTLTILHLCSHFIYDEILLRFLSKHHKLLLNTIWIHMIVLCIVSILIAVLFLQPEIYSSIIIQVIFWIGTFLLMIRSYFSFQYLHTKVNYYHIAYHIETALSSIIQKFNTQREKKYVVEQQEYNTDPSSTTSSKQHLYFLNDLFFKRHTKLIHQPFMLRLKICSSLFLICFAICIFFIDKLEISIIHFIPMFFLPMYYFNISEPVNHALFHNCDKYLLHYQVYRQKNIILKNFFIRLLHLLKYNLILTTILCIYASILIYLIEATPNFATYVYIWGSLFIFSIFFTINGLFLYYMFQPYSMDEEVQSPIYFILQSIVVFIAMQLLNIKGNLLFCTILLGITILYCIIVMLCTYKYAPKTFRIK